MILVECDARGGQFDVDKYSSLLYENILNGSENNFGEFFMNRLEGISLIDKIGEEMCLGKGIGELNDLFCDPLRKTTLQVNALRAHLEQME